MGRCTADDRREMDAEEARICAEVGKPRLPAVETGFRAGTITSAGARAEGAPAAAAAQPVRPAETDRPPPVDIFNFDLNGYLVLEGALTPQEVADLNATLDEIPPLEPQEWHGRVHRNDYVADKTTPPWGVNLQNIVEAGPAFESLIDHPSWIDHCRKFVGQQDLYIDESFVTIRSQPGTGSPLHSGAHKRAQRTQFRYHDGQFHCGEINILIALDDVGPGDGATTVMPGSHKSNIIHPAMSSGGGKIEYDSTDQTAVDAFGSARAVFQKAGDVLLFVDCCVHGSAPREAQDGQRRFVLYRYGPSWANSRYGYPPSVELLQRLTPEQRKIIQPIAPLLPPGEEQILSEATGAVSQANGFGRLPTTVRDAAFDIQAVSAAKL